MFYALSPFIPVSGSLSKCAGLTRSRETVSFLPFISIFMTLPLLTMGRRKGRLEAVQLRFFAKIHVSMCRFPYIGKCCSEVSHAVGTDGDATWLRRAYQKSYLCASTMYFCDNLPYHKRFRRLTHPITL